MVRQQAKSALRNLMMTSLATGFALMQWACQPEAGEAYSSRKLSENKAEIEAYLQKNGIAAQQTETNLYYVVTQANPNGQKPAKGDEIQFHYTKYRLDGVIVDSTASASPARVIFDAYTYGLAPGIFEGVQLLREGETATFFLPYNLQSVNQGTLLFPAFSPARYQVRVLSVQTEEEQITDYLAANKLTGAEKTSSGLRFLKTAAYPDSAEVKTGQTVTLRYRGRFLTGVQFDPTTGEVGTLNFKPGEGQVIKGYEEAVLKMRVGEKATIVLPSSIGYGTEGNYNRTTGRYSIPPYTPLMFEIEVVSSK